MSDPIRNAPVALKYEKTLGLCVGYAIVCKDAGEPYVDLQGDYITESAMLEAALDFAENSRVAKEDHDGDAAGSVPMIFPLTAEIAKALEIEATKTGLLIAMKPSADMLEKFESGELSGFSIGGRLTGYEELDDAA